MTDIKIDRAGIRKVLKSPEVAATVHGYARRIASAVKSSEPEADVVVDDYATDRAASSVTIRDARGRIWQARDGILTRAAAGVGLEVKER